MVGAADIAALTVMTAWKQLRGKKPGQDNADAQRVCADYWRACTGEWAGNWRKRLLNAKELSRAGGSQRKALVNEIQFLMKRTLMPVSGIT